MADLSVVGGHVKKSDQQPQSKWLLISSTDDLDTETIPLEIMYIVVLRLTHNRVLRIYT